MKAWHTQTSDGEHQQIVFAETRGQAVQKSEAYGWTDYTDVRATRANYADGYENVKEKQFRTMQLQNGWWFECRGCSIGVTEEDRYIVDEKGFVYCGICQ